MERPVTLDDIARELGISKMTVSKALRGMRHVSPQTRKRVEAAAARLGYRPNPMVSTLMQQVRTRRVSGDVVTIAYIARNRSILREYDAKANLDGATARAAELGYRLEIFCMTDFGDAAHMGKVLYSRGIQGIICGAADNLEKWKGFPWERFSLVSSGLGHARLPVAQVRRNISQGIRLLDQKLREAGFRRPAVLFTQFGDSELDLIAEGALYLMNKYGPDDPSLIHPMDSPENIRKWIESCHPDVIVLHYPPNLDMLQQAGYDVDGPIPIVTLKSRSTRDPLAGIDHRPGEVGRTAVEYLNQEIQLNRTGLPDSPRTIMVDCAWVDTPGFLAMVPSGRGN
jgi:DNA-binding LacI/PurR family transcriptional regulator